MAGCDYMKDLPPEVVAVVESSKEKRRLEQELREHLEADDRHGATISRGILLRVNREFAEAVDALIAREKEVARD